MFKKYLIQILSLLCVICFTSVGMTLFSSRVAADSDEESVAVAKTESLYSSSDYFNNSMSSEVLSSKLVSSQISSNAASSNKNIKKTNNVSSAAALKKSKPKPKDYIEQLEDKLQEIPSDMQKPPVSSSSTSTSSKTPSSSSNNSNSSSKVETSSQSSSSGSVPDNDEMIFLSVNGEVKEYKAIDAVAENVAAEMDGSFEDEAIKAQAVAAHTYMTYANSFGKAPVLPMRTPSEKIKKLVNSVMDKLIYYDNKPINAVYFATAAGYTANSEDVWGSKIPYLRSVVSEYDHLANGYKVTKTYLLKDFKNIIKDKTDISLSGSADEWIKIVKYADGGYIGSLSIGGKTEATINGTKRTITGFVFRDIILEYGIRSTNFDYSADDTSVNFTTYGYGHGVGMSQNGANMYAKKENRSYTWILKHYYTGVEVK